MTCFARVLCGLTVAAMAAAPLPAQRESSDLSYQWYWGAQVGSLGYATRTQPTYWDPMVGGHWFITARRVGLYAAAEQAFFTTDARTTVGSGVVTFSQVRRILLGVVALPSRKALEPFVGGGFALAYVVNPVCTGCAGGDFAEVKRQSSAAFAWGMIGGQYNVGKLSVFGHYLITDGAGFLIEGATHTIQGGLRYSLGNAREEITRR